MSVEFGKQTERQAVQFLKKQGLQFIESNFRCRWGEVDVIMRDASTLVFVEVRARSSFDYGGAIASITVAKQRKLIKTANYYLLTKKLHDKCAARFDVVLFEGKPLQIEWIKNAFDSYY
ncbi:hypothetical protein Lqui_0839 [Legionella quinlivanii]|uniref:UPF0102 protein Lqui_0839 n=1 Tax=Legionella quinlivanii TaxID=45073 RepID=A0A0W0Y4T6_9GAMM|nr:YraN family protein [Legionella quinlivanii]KTD51995.1 hypothetical protein Lqui_0839 [Legionella quinlivanii]SEF86970.1 putative endonuclease [Legionella quinlivanii DSM 21216]STY12510.1 putative endonuclease distantly related to archaeal Holliday junction resolvase [Legionella quinlivanii]